MPGELYVKVKDEIQKRLKHLILDRDHHVPYLGGQSKKRDRVYIDSRCPSSLTFNGKKYDINKYLSFHEVVEKTIEDVLGTSYNVAHHEAEWIETQLIKQDGLDPVPYHKFITESYRKTLHDFDPTKVPKDLDLKPYEEDKLTDVVKKITDARK